MILDIASWLYQNVAVWILLPSLFVLGLFMLGLFVGSVGGFAMWIKEEVIEGK